QQPAPQQSAPQQPAPQQPAPQQPAPPPAKPADPPPVVTVLGPGCSGKGAYRENGRFSKGIEGWIGNSGGWSGDGCNGSYTSVPMSGDASKDDSSASVVWTFNLGNVSTCALSVYVPASGDVTKVGGHPTYYTVQSGGPGRSFVVNQTSSQGSWVDVGSYSYGGPLAVTLHTRGVDWGGGESHAHHAASAIRATCTS
ncbi:adhesin, partial [Kitasatospora sp. NPDC093558]